MIVLSNSAEVDYPVERSDSNPMTHLMEKKKIKAHHLNNVDFRHLQGGDEDHTVLLRLSESMKGHVANLRRSLLETLGVNKLDVFHSGGGYSGTAKDWVALRIGQAILEQNPTSRGEGLTLDVFTSGNTTRAMSRAFKDLDVRAKIQAYVNKEIGLNMQEVIEGDVDSIKILNGTSPEPFGDILGGINPDAAHRRHLFRVVLSGLRPKDIFVPVGSGIFAGNNVIASRVIAAANILDELGFTNVDQHLLEIYPREEGEHATFYDRVEETPDFMRLFEYLKKKYPRKRPLLDDIRKWLPSFYLCGESGLLLSLLKKHEGSWGANVVITGARGSVGLTETSFERITATKLWMPRGTTTDVEKFVSTLNDHDPDKIYPVECSGGAIKRVDKYANDARLNLEPSSSVAVAGVQSVFDRAEFISKPSHPFVMSSGRGVYPHPDRSNEIVDEEPPFKGWKYRK